MDWQQLIIETFRWIPQVLEKALDGLTKEDLNYQPKADCNSVGWLVWHLSRVQDRFAEEISGEEQLWIKDKWYARFDRPPDPDDRGFGHTVEDLAAFKSPDAGILLDYHRAVFEHLKPKLQKLSMTDLDRKLDHPYYPTVGLRVAGVINDNIQHLGQVAYLRGLMKGKGWLET